MSRFLFEDEKPVIVRGEDNIFATFLTEKGLYDSIEINEANIYSLIALIAGQVRINVYCKECQTERVFSMEPCMFYRPSIRDGFQPGSIADELDVLQKMLFGPNASHRKENGGKWDWIDQRLASETRIMVFKFVCSMDSNHHLDFVVLTSNNTFRKIGQYPSIADLTFPELNTYKKVITPEDRKEFGTAIGLYANGVGAGSYVYLRRILERLLNLAKTKAGSQIDSEAFEKARVADKITMLKTYLPSALTENPTLYGILSKGIHELSEAECLAYFPVLKDCLYMILDQWEEMRKKEEKQKSIQAALSKIATNL